MGYRHEEYQLLLNNQTVTVELRKELEDRTEKYRTGFHSHGNFELQLILEGTVQVIVAGESVELHQGEAILLAPGTHHRTLAEQDIYSRLVLMVNAEKYGILQMEKQFSVFRFDQETEAVCVLLKKGESSREMFRKELRQALVTQLVIRVFQRLNVSVELPTAEGDELHMMRIHLIDRYFEYHYMDRGGMPKLAEELHLSCRQLGRLLQTHYGMGFQEKVTLERMQRAALMLIETELTSTVIAEKLGYGSETTFFQNFRKWFSMTPQQYRMQNRNID